MEYSNNVLRGCDSCAGQFRVYKHSLMRSGTICRHNCIANIERASSALLRCTVSILCSRKCAERVRMSGNTCFQTSYVKCSELRLHQVCEGMKIQTLECLDLHFWFWYCPISFSVIHLETPWNVTTDLVLQYWHRQADFSKPSEPQLWMASKCTKCIKLNVQ